MGLLDNKTAIITGASRGIGKAVAELFSMEGAELVLFSRNLNELHLLKAALEKPNAAPVHIFEVDISNLDQLKSVFNQLNEQKIVADILVNNAGIMLSSTLQVAKPDLIEKIFSTNVFGSMYCAQLALKGFLKKRKGSIINMSSILGINGSAGQSIYSASKAAIIGFTKSLSKELAPLNIRVNAIAPGFIDTDLTKGIASPAIGMRRNGSPLDVAKTALFLASDQSDYITGQIIGVDGGMII